MIPVSHTPDTTIIPNETTIPITITYAEGDELIHTADHPFCDSETCYCNLIQASTKDQENIALQNALQSDEPERRMAS